MMYGFGMAGFGFLMMVLYGRLVPTTLRASRSGIHYCIKALLQRGQRPQGPLTCVVRW